MLLIKKNSAVQKNKIKFGCMKHLRLGSVTHALEVT